MKEQHNGLDEIDGSGKYSSGMLEYLLHIDGMLDEVCHVSAPPRPRVTPAHDWRGVHSPTVH